LASFTEKLGLKKPDRSDKFSIEDFNGNMDIIDTIPDMASGQSVPVGTAYAAAYGAAVTPVIGTATEVTE
jgi:hypothetical protein